MRLIWDEDKRARTLAERGLDFARCSEVFAGVTYTFPDERDYAGEQRFICVGFLRGRMVVLVYTDRGATRRIISMRKANEREKAKYTQALCTQGPS